MLVLTASALQLLDDKMHQVASMPFLSLKRIAESTLHENGMIINTPAAVAIQHSIEGGETLVITVMAPTDRAKDFRIKFLEAE